MIKSLQRLVFHPFLFAIYPPLFLLINNLHQLKLVSGLRAILISLLFSTLLFFILRLITKDSPRSALITSFVSILFYAYGPIHSLIPAYRVFGSLLTNQRFMLIFWVVIFFLMIWLVGWKLKNPAGLNTFMNYAGSILVVILLIQAGWTTINKSYKQTNELLVEDVSKSLHPPLLDQRPDVYYIILDSYSSSKVLKDEYQIDNSDFIEGLKQRGFYVAECSHSNYPHTVYSLVSSLNMNYIPPVGEQFLNTPQPWLEFASYFRSNSVRNAFVEMGYKTVTFDTFFPWTSITNSDIYITPRNSIGNETLNILSGGTNDYEEMLMDMTPLVNRSTILAFFHIDANINQPIMDDLTGSIPNNTRNAGEQKILYGIYKYDFDHLGSIPSYAGKKFVYAHFLSTHRPYIFSADGSFKFEESLVGYANTIAYTDNIILKSIDEIISHSDPKPVIIIQGDHAAGSAHDHFGILNAYYLPGVDPDVFYPTLSPVNSFRIVFNEYFGGNFPLLPDLSYPVDNNTDWKMPPDPMPGIPSCP